MVRGVQLPLQGHTFSWQLIFLVKSASVFFGPGQVCATVDMHSIVRTCVSSTQLRLFPSRGAFDVSIGVEELALHLRLVVQRRMNDECAPVLAGASHDATFDVLHLG